MLIEFFFYVAPNKRAVVMHIDICICGNAVRNGRTLINRTRADDLNRCASQKFKFIPASSRDFTTGARETTSREGTKKDQVEMASPATCYQDSVLLFLSFFSLLSSSFRIS